MEKTCLGLQNFIAKLVLFEYCRRSGFLKATLYRVNSFVFYRPQNLLSSCPDHWFSDLNNVHVYSLHELVQVNVCAVVYGHPIE